ncbi:MAG TPA: type I phosphomannose isomerase catalytic subunit [Candidatus Limnocylindrales bacterium]|nr:type I phosphomannose isomerase catalytic subunit [Candidatus Limnocylindrales bacterium]
MKPAPARLEPTFSPRPWGALSLAPFFPEKANLTEPLGEAWMTGVDCRFAPGPFGGRKLGEAWTEMDFAWKGTSIGGDAPFPLLVKFLFTEEKLSIQVHPDDAYASLHEAAAGGRGKTEMWYALLARPDAEVLVGLKPDVTPDQFKRAIADNTAEKCLERVPMRPGDAVFVPARTAHTIGAGLVLCEIQEYSDLTYRVYDYNRLDAHGKPRELHIEKALEVLQFGDQGGGKLEPLRVERGPLTETYFIASRYFVTEKWDFAAPVSAESSPEHFDLFIFLEGAGSIEWGGDHSEYSQAQAWLIPASLGAFQLSPRSRTSLLRTYAPSGTEEFARRLEAQGVDRAAWSRLVHP